MCVTLDIVIRQLWLQHHGTRRNRRILVELFALDFAGCVLDRQLALLNTNTRYLHPSILNYAEALLERTPAPLDTVFFVCSGSEANELALRLARTHTKRHDVIVVGAAYHGNTTALIDISPYKFEGKG